MRQTQIQEMKPAVFVMFTNQLKTLDPEDPQRRYASAEKIEAPMTAMYGLPCLLHFLKMAGASPATAIE